MTRGGKQRLAYEEGEEVMAKWPGSNLWYEAVVLSANYEDDVFKLRFSDDQENEVPLSHLSVRFEFLSKCIENQIIYRILD